MPRLLWAVCIVTCLIAAHPGGAATLLLAHFDTGLDADYAAGGANGATALAGARGGTLGYFPGTPSGAADLGYQTPRTSQLRLPARGNLDTRQGTIEFFVKTNWDWSAAGVGGRPHPALLHAPLQDGGHLQVYAYHHELSGIVALAFNLYDGKQDHPLTAGVSPVGKREVDQPWKAEEWHHVAVSWSPTESRIFGDGKLLASRTWNPAMSLPPALDALWVGSREAGAEGVLIDELRIQDVPVTEMPVPTAPYTVTQAGGATAPEGAQRATMTCYRAPQPPTLDGKLDDPLWKQVPWVGGLHPRGVSGEYGQVPTRFALAWDAQALYLGVVCIEPNPAGILAKQTEHDSPVYGDDAVELFLDPGRRHDPYYQLVFNTLGTRFDGKKYDASWNGDWEARAVIGAREWTAEARIAWESLGGAPELGAVWGMNLARDRRAGAGLDLFTWSSMTGFHDAQAFGDVRFASALAIPAQTEEARLNAAYLAQTKVMLTSTFAAWRGTLRRLDRQLTSRNAPAALGAEAKQLGQAVEELGRLGQDLAGLDAARGATLGMTRRLDELFARVQQAVPLGPQAPPSGLRPGLTRKGDLFYFVSSLAVYAVDGRTGGLVGLWSADGKARVAMASVDHYWTETRGTTSEADELDDAVGKTTQKDGRLALACTNPDLKGVSLAKEYWLRPDGALARKVSVSGRLGEPTMLRAASRTYLDPAFRQGAYYQRLLHPGIATNSVCPAETITSNVPQPGFMGQSTDGCAQLCISNVGRDLGLGQFLLKVNDQYVYPPRAVGMSYLTPWGWEMSWLATFVRPEPFTAEQQFLPYRGDHLTFHQLYLALPEWKALHASYQICPWVKKTRFVTMGYVGWSGMPPGDTPLHPGVRAMAEIPSQLMRPGESMLYLQQPPGDNWGEWPAADGEVVRSREPNTDRFKSTTPCEVVRHGIQRLKGLGLPQFKPGFYQFPIDVSPGTEPERKGWYVVGKDGKPVNGWWDPQVRTYLCDISPEWIDYTVKAVARQLDYYGTDMLYFDYPYPTLYVDWKGEGRVAQTSDWMEFYRRIHEECAKRNVGFFFNSGSGAPYADAGIFEGIVYTKEAADHDYFGQGWRQVFGDPLLMMKMYEPEGFASHGWPWQYVWSDTDRDNTLFMTNYCLLLGMRTAAACNSEWGEQLKAFTPPGGQPEWLANARTLEPYHRGTYELANSRLTDVGLSPCWWREDTQIEAYALRMGPAHVLTALSHYSDARRVQLSGRRELLGLEAGKRTFAWVFGVRPTSSLVRQPDPPPPGWDRLCLDIACRSFVQGRVERETLDLGDMPPQLVRLGALTQVPAAVVSVDGQETQFPLPATLGIQLTGATDEKARRVQVNAQAETACEVVVWWPEAWGQATVEIKGPSAEAAQPVAAQAWVTYGGERFMRLALPAGPSVVKLGPAG